jgi:hypothetical protein
VQGRPETILNNKGLLFMANEPKLLLVEYIDEALIKTKGTVAVNGQIIHGGYYGEEIAYRGERLGKWRVVRDLPAPKIYETRMMTSGNPLTMTDVMGEIPKVEYQTKGVKKKKIIWIQDLMMIGGAEISCQHVVAVGSNCGFDINVVTQDNTLEEIIRALQSAELAIINNIWGFSGAQIQVMLSFIYGNRLPYVKYEHDHRELNRKEFSRPLFQRSKLNVFLSPMHRDNHMRELNCDGICLPLAIDTKQFKPVEGVNRAKDSAVICNVRNFKTWTNLQMYINEHKDMSFTVIADNPVVTGDNVKKKNMVSHSDMPKVYSEHEYLVHLLDGLGAGERVVFEAALCGCKVIANAGVGHMSWQKNLNDLEEIRSWLDAAPYQFWQEVEAIA